MRESFSDERVGGMLQAEVPHVHAAKERLIQETETREEGGARDVAGG